MILTHGAPDQLAALFAGLRALAVVDRGLHSSILRQALEANPRYLGVWAVWEPGALDGRDAEFINAPGHDDTGRFLPVWHRRFGDIQVEANVAINDPKRGAYYMLPTRMRRTVMVGPYEYPMGGAIGAHRHSGRSHSGPWPVPRRGRGGLFPRGSGSPGHGASGSRHPPTHRHHRARNAA